MQAPGLRMVRVAIAPRFYSRPPSRAPVDAKAFARIDASPLSRNQPPRRTLFVTTALPYANGPFHIGHIMEYIQADVWVRFQRMQGHDVHFVCADDAHGAPIMLKAESEGVTPQALVARIAATRPKPLDGFHISFDHWHSTDSPENVELSQDIYRKLKARGLDLHDARSSSSSTRSRRCSCRTATSRASARCAVRRTSTATPARVCSTRVRADRSDRSRTRR